MAKRMDREAFTAIEHGERIGSVRTSTPQVAEFDIHEVENAKDHPEVDSSNKNFAVAEQSMGKTVGLLEVAGVGQEEVPEMTVTKHPDFSHVDERLAKHAVGVVVDTLEVDTVALNQSATNVSISSPEAIGLVE